MTALSAPLPDDSARAGVRAAGRRRGRPDGGLDMSLFRVLVPDPARIAEGRALAARARAAEIAAGRPWPPAVDHAYTVRPRVESRPTVVLDGLATVGGCARGGDMPCAAAPGGRWPCPTCGTVTVVGSPVGPRLPVCTCRGDGPVCLHPMPLPRGRT